MKSFLLKVLLGISVCYSIPSSAQVFYALDLVIDYPTVSMADGKIIPKLVGNYPNPVEYHINNTIDFWIITDTLFNLDEADFPFAGMSIFAVDVTTADTIIGMEASIIFSDISFSWNTIIPPTSAFSCDGLIFGEVDQSITPPVETAWFENYATFSAGAGGVAGPSSDSLFFEGLCPGFYYISLGTAVGLIIPQIYIEPLTGGTGAFNIEVFTSPSSPDSCTANALATVSGGIPPYQYFWDSGLGTFQTDDLCPGLHTLKVIDAVSDSSMIYFGIADSAYFYEDTLFSGIPDDTIYFETESCGIDYGVPIDSIAITFVDFYSTTEVAMGFTIWQGTSTFYVQDTSTYGPPQYGLFLVDLTQFCLNKTVGGDVIKFRGPLINYLSVNENSVSDFNIYPNPANGTIQIEGANIEKISIYNLLGELVFTTTNKTIDVSEFPKGMYQIVLFDTNDYCLVVKKLVVQ